MSAALTQLVEHGRSGIDSQGGARVFIIIIIIII